MNDLRPASMCAMGIDNLDAAIAPARVEFVSPKTKTNSGLSINKILQFFQSFFLSFVHDTLI